MSGRTRLTETVRRAETPDGGRSTPALVGYLPAGFPDLATSKAAVRAMVDHGVDVVEVGIPYSDPLIDGPVIQNAADDALRSGFRVSDTFEVVREVVDAGGVAVVMSYWNPILAYGVDRFAAGLSQAGGSGVITPDLIPEEAAQWREAADRHDLAPIFLVAPSSTPERIRLTTQACRGFVYAASTMGVTGARGAVPSSARILVDRIREIDTELPVGVGLGVSTGAQAAEVAEFADAVIVGSALVRALADDPSTRDLTALVTELADGVASAGTDRSAHGQ